MDLKNYLKKKIKFFRTNVGDRYVKGSYEKK